MIDSRGFAFTMLLLLLLLLMVVVVVATVGVESASKLEKMTTRVLSRVLAFLAYWRGLSSGNAEKLEKTK